MQSNDEGSTCVVLVRNLGAGMLHDVVVATLQEMPGVLVQVEQCPDGTTADLVIEREELGRDIAPTILISEEGRALLALPVDELSESVLALVVNSIRGEDPDWLETVLIVSRRIDAIIERATEAAEDAYREGGGFEDWREAFANGGGAGGTSGGRDPLTSSIASESADVHELLRELVDPGHDHVPPNPPFAELIETYGLDGQEVDTVLLCFLHELDPRYGRRFAYLQQDATATRPTIELVAALLARSPGERLDLQRKLSSGALVTNGLVRLAPHRADEPTRSAALTLDPTVLRIVGGDRMPVEEQDLVDPTMTARTSPLYALTASARTTIDALGRGEAVHLAGADSTLRRGIALDAAASRGRRLLATTYSTLTDGQESGDDRRAVEAFRRELIRLDALGFVDEVPVEHDRWQTVLTGAGYRILSGGRDEARTLVGDGVGRRTIRVVGPRGDERTAVWQAAIDSTGIEPVDGADPLVSRFGISVDRAVAALQTALGEHRDGVTASDVVAVLTASGVDSAGGLLTTVRTRVRLDDLIIDADTRRRLEYACARIRHRDDVILDQGWDQRSNRLRGTYLLFAGPSGTGKTMAAEAIANELGLPIQYLELSSLLSRWVGEFEKSVDRVFAAAEATGGIITMNEADALLAPRTEVDNAQARYANAGTSHLLSRLEQFSGHIIFTSNLLGADSIDPAFNRRLTATIRFRLPDRSQRSALWRSVWPDATSTGSPVRYTIDAEPVARSSRLAALADAHALSGGSIANIARNAAFLATQRRASSTVHPATGAPLLDIDPLSLDEALRLELDKIGDFRLLMHSGVRS